MTYNVSSGTLNPTIPYGLKIARCDWLVRRLSHSVMCVVQQQMRQPMMMQQPGQQARMRMPGAVPQPGLQAPQQNLGQPGLTFNVPSTDEHGNLNFDI